MTQLAYIESTGEQYINTGILGRSDLRIELTAELTSNGNNMAFFGAKDTDATNRLSWFYYRNTELYYYYGSSGYPYVKRADYSAKHTYVFDSNKVYIDGTQAIFSSSISASTFSGKYPIAIFACNTRGTIVQRASMRLYAMAIYDGSTLLANYVPARDADGVVCLYDTVSASYLYNAGAGVFVAGAAVVERGYLIRSGSTLYTVTDGALVPLSDTEVSASLFRDYGADEPPDGSLMAGLTDPEVLYWHDSTDELPTLSLTVSGTPPAPQVVVTDLQDMSHHTIIGIKSATVTASEDVLWAISFDDGRTWLAYDGSQWAVLAPEDLGMTTEVFRNISLEAWADVVTSDAYRLRFALPSTDSYMSDVIINYIN